MNMDMKVWVISHPQCLARLTEIQFYLLRHIRALKLRSLNALFMKWKSQTGYTKFERFSLNSLSHSQRCGFATFPKYMGYFPENTHQSILSHHHHHRLSLNREGRWGTTDDFATSFLHFSLFSAALWDLANSRPVHSLMLSSHLFLCLPCFLPPFTVSCKMVLARPDEW